MRSFILVADGGRATLFFRSDQKPGLELVQEWDNLGGRTSDSETRSAGSLPETSAPSSPKKNSKRAFAQMLADTLRDRLSSYDELLLVAAPKTLGSLRKKLDQAVSRRIVIQLDKDLTHLSLYELQPIVEGLLGPRPPD